MTADKFDAMNEQEKQVLARRLANRSNVLSFDAALRIVQFDPAQAERLLRDKEEGEKMLEELALSRKRLHLAAREFG